MSLADCMKKAGDPCLGRCMQPTGTALGLVFQRGAGAPGGCLRFACVSHSYVGADMILCVPLAS